VKTAIFDRQPFDRFSGPEQRAKMPLLIFVFIALIVYGSLFPFTEWSEPKVALFSFLFSWPKTVEKADLVQNILAYAPLGLFLVSYLTRFMRFRPAIITATLAGTMLSLIMECIQQYLPSRISSTIDLAMNLLGTFAGGLLAAFLAQEIISGARFMALRKRWFRTGAVPDIALVTLALWALSQTSPLVPTFDMGQLRYGLSRLFHSLQAPEKLNIAQTLTYALYIAALGLLTQIAGRPGRPVLKPFALFIACVLALKVAIVGRQLSLEAVTGAMAAILVLLPLSRLKNTTAVGMIGIASIALGFTISELTAVPGWQTHAFNWVPFNGQMTSLYGFQNILESIWPFVAIACFVRCVTPYHLRDGAAALGGIVVPAVLFTLEWFQQTLPGRYGDVTQVMLGLAGWIGPWCASSADFINDDAAAPTTQTKGMHSNRPERAVVPRT
jgi:VanZ family protein